MKVGIVIIVYNLSPEIFLIQIEAIRKFCKDDFVIEIFNNSSNPELSDAIRYHSQELGLSYRETFASSVNGSESHSFSANFSYQTLRGTYPAFIYLDHDILPVKEFSLNEVLGEDKIIAGIGQLKKDITYFWPGCLFFRNDKIDNDLIDFSPIPGLDTGGSLYKVIEKYGMEACVFFNESYHQNPYFTHKQYGNYTMVNNKMFMHFVGASNWINLDKNEERINSLLNIAKELIK